MHGLLVMLLGSIWLCDGTYCFLTCFFVGAGVVDLVVVILSHVASRHGHEDIVGIWSLSYGQIGCVPLASLADVRDSHVLRSEQSWWLECRSWWRRGSWRFCS